MRLLRGLSAKSGMAFIILPHLDPTAEIHTVESLGVASAMPVTAAVAGRRIQPNHVYVVPRNRLLTVRGGRLLLRPLPGPRAARTGLDLALRSLAEDQGAKAMGIVLSGAGTRMPRGAAAGERVGAQLRAVLDATADAVVTVDGYSRIVTFNGSASRMFGYAPHEVIGRNIRILLPRGLRARRGKMHERHVIGASREVIGRRRGGTRFPALLSVSQTADAALIVACVRDLSADKAMQEEILHIATLEQQRIGQELHDGIQQELTGLGLLAQNLAEELEEGGAGSAGLAKRVAAGIAEANRHVRSLARGLVPAPIDAEGLPAALGELARSTQEMHKLSCRLDCPAAVKTPDAGTATHLFRIAQEAVGNAARHSKADDVLIRLEHHDDRLRLEIHDNGIGIPARAVPNPGVGLRLMEHRCNVIGGSFKVEPRPGGGTVVSCTVPLTGRS